MFLNKSKNGYSWYAKIESTDQGGNTLSHFLNFRFKKGTEPRPDELGKYESYEGELIFRDANGKERRVFPVVKEYNSLKSIEFILLGVDGAKPVDLGFTNDDVSSIFGKANEISPEDLPFY